MQPISRTTFIRQSSMALAALSVARFGFFGPQPLRLSFSTLGCPDWTFDQIVDFAATHGFSGIEFRGILRQLDPSKCEDLNEAGRIAATLQKMKSHKLSFVDLGSSCNLHIADPAKRKENLDNGRQFIDLAQQLSCPYVRVYPNNFPPEEDKNAVIERIVTGFRELGDYASGKKVMVLMETHGDAVHVNDVVQIMEKTNHPNTGLIWDISNMWTVAKEAPSEVYPKIKKWIHHTHIKDAKLVDGKPQYTYLGQGEVPIFEAIDLLRKDGYKGYFSFEWEKLWHPELGDPALAFADYATVMNKRR